MDRTSRPSSSVPVPIQVTPSGPVGMLFVSTVCCCCCCWYRTGRWRCALAAIAVGGAGDGVAPSARLLLLGAALASPQPPPTWWRPDSTRPRFPVVLPLARAVAVGLGVRVVARSSVPMLLFLLLLLLRLLGYLAMAPSAAKNSWRLASAASRVASMPSPSDVDSFVAMKLLSSL